MLFSSRHQKSSCECLLAVLQMKMKYDNFMIPGFEDVTLRHWLSGSRRFEGTCHLLQGLDSICLMDLESLNLKLGCIETLGITYPTTKRDISEDQNLESAMKISKSYHETY